MELILNGGKFLTETVKAHSVRMKKTELPNGKIIPSGVILWIPKKVIQEIYETTGKIILMKNSEWWWGKLKFND